MTITTGLQLAAREAAGEAPAGRARGRGPRRGFKHWTDSEDQRLREIVLTSLDRLGTLQAVAKESHAQFKRDEGSVLRRIRHLRQADAEFDAAIAGRVTRARALAEENRTAPALASPAVVPVAARSRRRAAAAAAGAPAATEETPAMVPAGNGLAGSYFEDSHLLSQFLEENSGPISSRQKARLADLVLAHGQVAVMAALADSLLHRADVILSDVEARLRGTR